MANIVEIVEQSTGDVYTLEFSRQAVRLAERNGFSISNLEKTPLNVIYDLMYYALIKNHRGISRQKAESLCDALLDLKGIEGLSTDGTLEALVNSYASTMTSLQNKDETIEKKIVVE